MDTRRVGNNTVDASREPKLVDDLIDLARSPAEGFNLVMGIQVNFMLVGHLDAKTSIASNSIRRLPGRVVDCVVRL